MTIRIEPSGAFSSAPRAAFATALTGSAGDRLQHAFGSPNRDLPHLAAGIEPRLERLLDETALRLGDLLRRPHSQQTLRGARPGLRRPAHPLDPDPVGVA